MDFHQCKYSSHTCKYSSLFCTVSVENGIPFQCNPKSQFTCWNGDCISLESRCDDKADCLDRSDEHSCQQIIFDKNIYRKTYVPRNLSMNDHPITIKVGFDVIDIVDINEAEVRVL